MPATFLRVLDPDPEQKGNSLAGRIADLRSGAGGEEGQTEQIFRVNPARFRAIPNTPFAYWVSKRIRQIFEEFPPLEGNAGTVKVGLQTSDDFRFVRAWWEVDPERIGYSAEDSEQGRGWIHFAKGGSYSPYYADVHLVVNWFGRGAEIKNFDRAYVRNEDFYFRPGLTWPLRSQVGLSVRSLPAGCVFGHKGSAIIPEDQSPALALLAVCNSSYFEELVQAQMAFGSYEVGVLQRTPTPEPEVLAELAVEKVEALFELRRSAATTDETTHEFLRAVLTQDEQASLSTQSVAVDDARQRRLGKEAELTSLIDREVGRLYRITPDAPSRTPSDVQDHEAQVDDAREASSHRVADLLSWCWGAAIGRWDFRIARSTGLLCSPSGPSSQLPRQPRGALVDRLGRAATRSSIASESWLAARQGVLDLPSEDQVDGPVSMTSADYPIDVAWDGILVDDRGHPNDILRRIREVLRHLYGDRAQAIEEEALEILQGDGRTPRTLRDWFRNQKATELGTSFFDFHIRRYSKSRRKAPIYWRLCSSPGRGQSAYGVWLYYHRLTDDTLWKVLQEYVTPRRELEERRLEEARRRRASAEGGELRKLESEIEERSDFLEEIGWFEEEIRKVAQSGWAPNRDDGVIINLAPLHRVVPWSEPERVWKKLEAGEYDWAHLAMRYWPERVQEKCRTDKSLAIAHDRLDLYEGEQ